MTPERRPVAVLGGTFDPVHSGHIALALSVRDSIGAGEAWLVPAATPALRAHPVAPAEVRLAMLEAAVHGIPGLRVVDVEMRRPGVSHTIDTLEALTIDHPGLQPWWILGADAARRLAAWHRSDELRAAIHLVIVQRSGSAHFDEAEARSLGLDPLRTVVLGVTPPAVSASEVRRRVAGGTAIAGLVPSAVADIIATRGLYRAAPVR